MSISESTDVLCSISEAAEIIGLSTHTLRYYERAGLMLAAVDRTPSTHRGYTLAEIEWVHFPHEAAFDGYVDRAGARVVDLRAPRR